MAAARALLAGLAAGDATDDDDERSWPRRSTGSTTTSAGGRWRCSRTAGSPPPIRTSGCGRVPLFVAGAGAAHGRYRDLVAGGLEILAAAPPDLLRQADFDLAALEELAFDPRAFDFMHPAASRPNYLFGLWDPQPDRRAGPLPPDGGPAGHARRHSLLADRPRRWPARIPTTDAELRLESSAVLAGVMLMASGLSGHGPAADPGGASRLGDLLPRIAGYRDAFYRWLHQPAACRGIAQRLEEEVRPAAAAVWWRPPAHQRHAGQPSGPAGGACVARRR